MRRWVCALQIGALLSVLCCGVASANLTFSPAPIDLSARLFAQCFGESTDRLASFSAVNGDENAESPLRDLALIVDPQGPDVLGTPDVKLPTIDQPSATLSFSAPVVNMSDATFSPSLHAPVIDNTISVPVIGYYENAAPVPTDAPLSHRFQLGAWHVSNNAPTFSLSSGNTADFGARGATVDMPLQLGRVRFSPHAQAGFTQDAQTETQPSLNDRSFAAGATLDVRAGHRDLGVDLTSGLEHVTLAQPQFSTSTSPNVGVAGDQLPMFVPAYADVNAHTISTGLTVPVTRSLTAGVQYDTQHLLGGYGTAPGLGGLDASNTIYGAQLTFNMPKGTSAISLSAHQFHFQNDLLPSNAVTQTSANLNYTVKF
jgi:hypothetical protein